MLYQTVHSVPVGCIILPAEFIIAYGAVFVLFLLVNYNASR